jgi:hypothetical protein
MVKRSMPTVESEAKIVIYSRVKPETVDALDEIREAMPFTPTRAQLIDAALAEYVVKHGKKRPASRTAMSHQEMIRFAKHNPPSDEWFDEDVADLKRPKKLRPKK